jgi:hypothetical protein
VRVAVGLGSRISFILDAEVWPAGMGVWVKVATAVTMGSVGNGSGVFRAGGVGVAEGVGLQVGVGVAVLLGVKVAVLVGVALLLGVGVVVALGVAVALGVGLGLAVGDALGLRLGVALGEGIAVAVFVAGGPALGQGADEMSGRASRAVTSAAALGVPRPVTASQPGPGAPKPLLGPEVMSWRGSGVAALAAI